MPSQNFVYADVDGHIGYYAPGRIPVRASRRRLAAGRRLDRRRRVDRLGSVRRAAAHVSIRPSTSSSPPTTGRRRAAYPLPARPRVARAVSRAAHHRPAARAARDADAGRLRAHPGRHALAAREGAAAAAARARAGRRRRATRQALDLLRAVELRRDAATAPRAAIFQAWFLQLAPALAGDDLGPARHRALPGPLLVRHAVRRRHADRRTTRAGATTCGRRGRETCDEAVTARARHGACDDLPRRLGQRHDALALGRACTAAMFPHQGLDAVARAASAPQPLGAERRRLEHGRTSAPVAADHPYEAALGARLPRDHRSLAGQRQPLPRRGRRVRPLRCRRTTTISSNDWRAVTAPEDADGPRRHRARRASGTCG